MNWMISMCVSLCLGSGLLLLEFYLSKKKAWQAGLIPILIVGLCACGLESYTEQQYRGYQIFTDAYPMRNRMKQSFRVIRALRHGLQKSTRCKGTVCRWIL